MIPRPFSERQLLFKADVDDSATLLEVSDAGDGRRDAAGEFSTREMAHRRSIRPYRKSMLLHIDDQFRHTAERD